MALRSEVTRKNGKAAGLERDAIEKAYKAFCKKGVGCALGKMTGKDIDNMTVNQLMGDGEVIIWADTSPRYEHGIKFRFIDPELMDVNHKERRGGNLIRMGVETNSIGVVVAYHFHSTDTTHADYYATGGRGYIRVEKRHIIHEFIFDYVDQLRGYPAMVAAMARLKMLDGYDEATLIASRIGASSMGFIERGENGETFEADMTIDDEDDDEFIESDDPEIETNPGDWNVIDHGAKIHSWNPNQPSTAYKDFVKTILRSVASGLGVDYNTLANDLEGVNFSSLRGGVLESREFWKVLQEWLIDHVKTEMYERWLNAALMKGVIRLPRGDALRLLDFDRLKAHSFQGRRWAWVDPLKDLQAAKLGIDEGLISRSEVIREQGRDPDQVWEEIRREKELMSAKGVEVVSASPQVEEKPDTNENDEGDQNADEKETD